MPVPIPAPRSCRGAMLAAALAPLVLAACAGPQEPSPNELACYRDSILAWVGPAYADDPAGLPDPPPIRFAEQGSMRHATLTMASNTRVLGMYGMGVVTLWDRGGLGDFGTQSTLAHELAHWIDDVEGRQATHQEVYDLQAAWEEAHWPDGVAC